MLVVVLISIIPMWVVFSKAGKPGWASIVPIYNMIVLLEICGRPIWWLLLMFIPCVNIVFAIMLLIDLAKAFGKGAGFGVGLILLTPIFMMILAFSSAKYEGPPNTPA
ncbi:MAG: signal peptidase I [Planctomycetaceae bacterium]|nr:signal peptidase I [Planctomycetaceae bacterium]